MAGIHGERFTRHQIAAGNQAEDHIRHILRTTRSLQGRLGFLRGHEGIVVLAHSATEPVSLDKPWRHRIDAHPLWTQDASQGLGHGDQGPLGSAIGNTAAPPGECSHAGNRNDFRTPRRFEVRPRGPHTLEGRLHIDIHQARPYLVIHRLEIIGRDERGRASIIDEDIQSPKFLHGSLHHAPANRVIGDITLEEGCLHATCLSLRTHPGSRLTGLRVIDQHRTPLPGQRERSGGPYPTTCPGHNRRFPLDQHGVYNSGPCPRINPSPERKRRREEHSDALPHGETGAEPGFTRERRKQGSASGDPMM